MYEPTRYCHRFGLWGCLVNPAFARTYDSLFGEGSFEQAEAKHSPWYGRKRPYAAAMVNAQEESSEDSSESSEDE